VGIFCGGGGRDDDTQLIINNVNEWFDVSDGEVVFTVKRVLTQRKLTPTLVQKMTPLLLLQYVLCNLPYTSPSISTVSLLQHAQPS
jgi:hypothetical protein